MKSSKGIYFWKMHGLGNDFMLVDGTTQSVMAGENAVKQWADRHTGVGFDQLLLLLPSDKADVFCRIFNSDGSEAEQCGNGMRCVARYLQETGKVTRETITIETRAGIVNALVRAHHDIEVVMGIPILTATPLVFDASSCHTTIEGFAASLGNPHVIIRVDSLRNYPVAPVAQEIVAHKIFPEGVNVGFMQILGAQEMALRTVERGAGETLACGSNACAAVVIGVKQYKMTSPVMVQLPQGTLEIAWAGENTPVKMTGEAVKTFEGLV